MGLGCPSTTLSKIFDHFSIHQLHVIKQRDTCYIRLGLQISVDQYIAFEGKTAWFHLIQLLSHQIGAKNKDKNLRSEQCQWLYHKGGEPGCMNTVCYSVDVGELANKALLFGERVGVRRTSE